MAKLWLLDSPYAKAFHLIQEYQKYQYISPSEKSLIKDLIIRKDASVSNLLCSRSDLEMRENLQKLIKTIRLQIELQQNEDDDVSTSTSLKFFLRQKLKLKITNSNFDLAINKR
ncbi:unnamed protein product (macronuclear) [Paramecium tetraurelia]|uniref:Uncharacterized protein n=1 Tax=Paramecium tetraurelia TaxID=5888 RepID=A0DSC2_PARTE|nr:uncharacterized protein GSPATT00019643001 [Paramecium tetraurelia]CAK85939.1 unnamed protein product [Paramecium tetraurelia]|eukprot:XP_001453336.1 hypothetical protein (macronuclear) [Paramecium tetraurelia strain d4-2]